MLREQLKQILDEQPRKEEIKKAIELESKVRFFTDPADNMQSADAYLYDFLTRVKERLNNQDSFNNFKSYLTFPLKINEFLESIYSKLSNIWQGQNPYFEYSFKTKKEDYQDLIDLEFFRNEVWNEFKVNYNSVILTDLPKEGETIPFNILVKIALIKDVLTVKNSIKHLIFEYKTDQIAVIDDETYQLWGYENSNLSLEPIYEAKHGLDRCPAVWLSEIDFNSKSNIVKSNAISKSLGKIEDLQILYTLKNILSPYAFYQFIVKYKNDSACNYDNGKMHCDGGYLKYNSNDTSVYQSTSDAVLVKCPQCNKQPGVGDVIQKPIPLDSNDPELKDVISFIAPDTKIMEYGDKYLKELEADLFDCIVGTDENLNPNENHNEMAYKYNTEGQQDVIFRWKSMFENVISKVHDNILELKYESNYKGNNINLGTEFILSSLDSLYAEKERLNKLGLSQVLDFNKTIINAKYQSNPDKRKRALIINEFKPFDEGLETLEASAKDGLIDKKDYIKQKYLNQIISNFESEVIPLDAFDKEVPVKKITRALNDYFEKWYKNKFENEQTSE